MKHKTRNYCVRGLKQGDGIIANSYISSLIRITLLNWTGCKTKSCCQKLKFALGIWRYFLWERKTNHVTISFDAAQNNIRARLEKNKKLNCCSENVSGSKLFSWDDFSRFFFHRETKGLRFQRDRERTTGSKREKIVWHTCARTFFTKFSPPSFKVSHFQTVRILLHFKRYLFQVIFLRCRHQTQIGTICFFISHIQTDFSA